MLFKDKIKRVVRKRGVKQGAKATLVGALLVAAVFGGGSAAIAAKSIGEGDHYTYDYMPAGKTGYYNSSDDGARAGIGATGSQVLTNGRIDWFWDTFDNNTAVHVQLALKDTLCDGDAAVAQVDFMQGDYVANTGYWINTSGCGTTVIEHATFYEPSWEFYSNAGDNIHDTDGIRITICNGGESKYGPMYFCGAQHGPFHH